MSTIGDALFNSKADKQIAHLSRLLSTANGIDSSLCFACYALTLVHSQLDRLLSLNLQHFAVRIARQASKTLVPGETIIATLPAPAATARLAAAHGAVKTLAGMCSDVRAFTRLWSLLSIWIWARGTYYNGPKDAVLKTIAWGQVVANALYLIFEHPAYLAGKGVLKGYTAKQQAKLWTTSGKFFALHVILDFVRLWRVRQMNAEKSLDGEKEDKIARAEAQKTWWRELSIDMAYAPLVLHWSMEGGLVSSTWVGLLGSWAGAMRVRKAWQLSA